MIAQLRDFIIQLKMNYKSKILISLINQRLINATDNKEKKVQLFLGGKK